MVSSTAPPSQSSYDSKTAPLSYAERAKKGTAQNIKPPAPKSVASLHQPIQHQNAAAKSNINPATAPSPIASTSTTGTVTTSASTASKSSSPSPSVDLTPNSSVVLTRPQTRPPSPSSLSMDPAEGLKASSLAADVADNDEAVLGKGTPSPSARTSPQKPAYNVWNARMEQMAQARAQTRPPPPIQASKSQTTNGTAPTPAEDREAVLFKSHSSSLDPQLKSASTSPRQTTRSLLLSNGSHPAPPVPPPEDDPFVVRPRIVASQPTIVAPPPPPAEDAESWPEVGKANTSPVLTQSNGQTSNDKGSNETKDGEVVQPVATPPKKGAFPLPFTVPHLVGHPLRPQVSTGKD
ncbi:hypothetical protein JAAARDRAFT_600724 [Jaapia argillacea MUCL 33604]|uniref:Uncharacterized protein n=1 Tax=Jaapia argillacea MUCL 33604 TaxID=933084 RepID=A0A067PZV0_9AGAM|nr:hypothetical protein JAAARDRAFT_600724 [Jaapia argillacea MUCL 33604]